MNMLQDLFTHQPVKPIIMLEPGFNLEKPVVFVFDEGINHVTKWVRLCVRRPVHLWDISGKKQTILDWFTGKRLLRSNQLKTFRDCLSVLIKGDYLVVPFNPIKAGQIEQEQTSFIYLANLFYRTSGKELGFSLISGNPSRNLIHIEKPIFFRPDQSYRVEEQRIISSLRENQARISLEQSDSER